ncbi:hypothetical protein IH980_04835 [Patescibacteria group bacterium]|nr:hypothetical protein [Patescibacteria group bacterium]
MAGKEVFINTARVDAGKRDIPPGIIHRIPSDLAPITNFKDIRGERLADSEAIFIHAGDGSTSYTINELLHFINSQETDISPETIPPFVLLGGGSANTLLKGLLQTPKIELPRRYNGILPPNSFEVRAYRPPQLTDEEGIQYLAYLATFGHLSNKTTEVKEKLATRWPKLTADQIRLAYVAAGISSLISLHNRVEPREVSFTQGGKQEYLEGNIAASPVISVPILGTFSFNKPIKPDTVRLLALTSENELELHGKYGLVLLIGGLFPSGPDMLTKWGILESHDASAVNVVPNDEVYFNSVIDGNLSHVSGKTQISRSPYILHFIIPNEVSQQYAPKK